MLDPNDFVTPSRLVEMTSPAGFLDTDSLYIRLRDAYDLLEDYFLDLEDQDVMSSPVTKRDKVKLLQYTNGVPSNSTLATTELNDLRNILKNISIFAIPTAFPPNATDNSELSRNQLLQQADVVYKEMEKRFPVITSKKNDAATPASTSVEHKVRAALLNEFAKLMFGRYFKVYTSFTHHYLTEVQTASSYANTYTEFFSTSGVLPVETWMTGVARVRPRMGEYHKQMLLSESVRYNSASTSPFVYTQQTAMQFPVINNPQKRDQWIAMELPKDYPIPLDAISMVVESSSTPIPTCGMVVDEWPEQIPIEQITTGISINYDTPSNEAPQAILLAVTPEITGQWKWDDLMETLNETIDMAKIRAVEPDMIQRSELAQVLPALIAQMSGDSLNNSPSLDFARYLVPVPNGDDDTVIVEPND
jgi:hypothetical protein